MTADSDGLNDRIIQICNNAYTRCAHSFIRQCIVPVLQVANSVFLVSLSINSKSTFANSIDLSSSNVLLFCKRLLSSSSANYAIKRIFISLEIPHTNTFIYGILNST